MHQGSTSPHDETSDQDSPVVYKRTQLGPNRYNFFQKVALSLPPSRVWTEAGDFEKLVAIALPGIAQDFQWLDGGGPHKVPSHVQFLVGGTPIHEEVYAQDPHAHSLRYRLVVPALGIAAYDAEVKLLAGKENECTLLFTRDITFEAGVDPADLSALIEKEGYAMREHFCK